MKISREQLEDSFNERTCRGFAGVGRRDNRAWWGRLKVTLGTWGFPCPGD